jgi:hypothetical protein
MMFATKPLVFLSYSRKDQEKVDDLLRKLKSKGIRTWLDRQDIVAGEWRQSIKRGLRQSNFFLACLSQNTAQRGEVLQYEYDSALEIQRDRLEGDIYLIPVRLEECEVPESLRHLEYRDVYKPSEFDALIRILRSKSKGSPLMASALALIVILALLAGYLWWRPDTQTEFLETRAQGKSAKAVGPVRLGVTFWKMEKARKSDPPSVREVVHPRVADGDKAETEELTPARLATGSEFHLGDKFQARVESNREGYLYVIDRALRQNGSVGPASLIFPTNRLHGGDNHVWPGRLVRLPDRASKPPYWVFESRQSGYAGETFIFLLTASPLDGYTAQEDATPVPDDTVAEWVKKYGAGVRLITSQSQPLRLTVDEATASDQGTQLSRSAPPPQMVFQAKRPAGGSIAAVLQLKVEP